MPLTKAIVNAGLYANCVYNCVQTKVVNG